MAPTGADQETVALAELAGHLFIGELQLGAALHQHYQFMLDLVVPEVRGARRLAGVNPLQAQAWLLE
jgi:hypothetical protein